MVGYDHQTAFKEIESYLSERERVEIMEFDRQEAEGNIPKRDYLTELYQEFERDNTGHMRILTELVGVEVALMEGADPTMRDTISALINQDTSMIETLRKEILHGRETVTELKRLSGR